MLNELNSPNNKNSVLHINDNDLDFDDDVRMYLGTPFTGIGFTTFKSGRIESDTPYLNGLPNGICREWYDNGQKKKEWIAIHGTVHGTSTEWHANGSVRSLGQYEYGVEVSYKEWSPEGKLIIDRVLPLDSPLRKLIEKLKITYSSL